MYISKFKASLDGLKAETDVLKITCCRMLLGQTIKFLWVEALMRNTMQAIIDARRAKEYTSARVQVSISFETITRRYIIYNSSLICRLSIAHERKAPCR